MKLLENSLKSATGKDNYEGTNHIFSILKNLMIKENDLSSSYTNRTLSGHILFLTISIFIL